MSEQIPGIIFHPCFMSLKKIKIMLEALAHTLGLCGENHLSIISILNDVRAMEQIKNLILWMKMKL